MLDSRYRKLEKAVGSSEKEKSARRSINTPKIDPCSWPRSQEIKNQKMEKIAKRSHGQLAETQGTARNPRKLDMSEPATRFAPSLFDMICVKSNIARELNFSTKE